MRQADVVLIVCCLIVIAVALCVGLPFVLSELSRIATALEAIARV